MPRVNENLWSTGLIFLICLVSFGFQIPGLGFYWDDYASMYLHLKDNSLTALFSGQARPVAGYLGTGLWQTFGVNPTGWHLVNWGLTVLAVILFWRILRLLWPEYKTQTTLIALLFAVYPSYQLRPIAISFYLLCPLALFLFSFWLSLVAAKKQSIVLSILAALLIPVYQMIYEQNLGYEALRPLAIGWVMLQGEPFNWQQWREAGWKFARIWFPYPLVTLGVLIYRFIIFDPDPTYANYNQFRTTNPLLLFKMSIAAPVEMISLDWVSIPWRVFGVEKVDFDLPGTMATLFVFAAVLYFWQHQDGRIQQTKSVLFTCFFSLAGISILLLSVHLVGRALEIGFNSRWALTPSPLAALVVGLMVPRIVRSAYLGQLLLLGLVALGIAVQVGVNEVYAADWKLRQQLGWQMRWRAPQLEPETMLIIILPPEHLAFGRTITDYEVTGHANLYYSGDEYPFIVGTDDRLVMGLLGNNSSQAGVWSELISGSNVTFRNWQFDLDHAVVFAYDGGCLHMADEKYRLQILNFPTFDLLARYQHSGRIGNSTESQQAAYQDAIEPEAEHDWCFYYQHVELALQFDHLEQAEAWVDEARANRLAPTFGHEEEWIPFIETYNRAGRYDEAEALIYSIAQLGEYEQNVLCERLRIQLTENPAVLRTQLRLLSRCVIP